MENFGIQAYLLVSAVIFGVVALIHLARVIYAWTFLLGPLNVPIIASWVGFALTGLLCAWGVWLLLV